MKKLLIGIGVVVVLLVLAAFIVPALIPADAYKGEIVSRLEAATGRTVRIDGPMTLSVLPVLGVSAEKVSVANAPGRSPAQMVTLDKLDVRVALFPLLHGQLVVDAFVLEKPVIALSVDKAGTPNWQFAAKSMAASAPAPAPSPKNPPPAAPAPSGGAPISGLSLSDVRIVDGQASYADARTGASYQADAINMTVSLPSLTSPMQATGSLVWNQQKISLTLNVADPNALLSGASTAIDAKLSGDPLTLAFKGRMSSGKAVAARGALDLDVPSVRKLAAWAGKPLTAPGSGFGPLKISGTVDVAGAKAAFTKATLSLDAIKGSGDFRYDGTGAKPDVNARLALGTLDLNPYLPPQSGGGGTGAPAAPSGPAHPASAPAGAAPSHAWSDAPIDFSPLRAADADLDLAVDGLVYRKIKIGKSHLTVALKGGRLVADLTDMALYQGNGKAKVTADASQATSAVGLDFDLAGVQANPLLSDAMDLTRLEGTANGTVSVTGHGASQRAIVSSLDGSGKVQFLNGAIRGIDIPAMVRNVTSAFTGGQGGQQKTDFSEMSGTFTIKNGILTNNDMAMQSPLLRVSGKGTVDIPKQTVDYRLEPTMVASLQGQGGAGNLGGLTVPVVIQGPWDNLSYKPDLSAMVKSLAPNAPKSLNDLKNLFKGGGSSSDQTSGSGSSAPAQNPLGALKGLLGK